MLEVHLTPSFLPWVFKLYLLITLSMKHLIVSARNSNACNEVLCQSLRPAPRYATQYHEKQTATSMR